MCHMHVQGHVVLVGDQKQLAPTVVCCNQAADVLRQSLFARLLKAGFPYHMCGSHELASIFN